MSEPNRQVAVDTPWEFVQDDVDGRRGVARVLTARNELVCETTPERANIIVRAAPNRDELAVPCQEPERSALVDGEGSAAKRSEKVCGFCKGGPVGDAASWLDGKPRPPAPCPRCGKVSGA